jgi:diguanylate cyclase (GGDEF)-like protein
MPEPAAVRFIVVTEGPTGRIDQLLQRARAAASPDERASCLKDIESALEEASDLVERAQLFMCRARVHSASGRLREVVQDATAAMALFEEAGETALGVDAASFAAASAARCGQMSLAAELATKTILGLSSVADDALIIQITNDLGVLCYSFLDYERAARQCEMGLAAAERAGDRYHICGQLYNLADILLRSVLVSRTRDTRYATAAPASPRPEETERLERAGRALQRLRAEAPFELQLRLGSHELQAEYLLETGHAAEALRVIATAAGGTEVVYNSKRAAFARTESRCLRALGQGPEAVEAADRAVQLAQESGDDHELMLALGERMAAKRAAGDLEGALGDAVEAKSLMWAIHQRQTAQVVEEVWVRAALERERRQLEEMTAAAVRTAEEDALTRIGNRRLLERFLARAGEAPVTLALVMADIDHFKDINDTFGHELGDMVLCALAELFAAETRSGQVVVRYGGEEFVFAMLGAELAAACNFAERVRTRVASFVWNELDTRLSVTISLGVSAGRSDAWRSVLAAADDALYMAKRLGRNRVESAQSSLKQTAG